ncbi:MAG: radical SAM protein [Candidatus Omnitrophica bacterium]|nr:radical SAM protein [Candidatus Omnitrophota bacterium]
MKPKNFRILYDVLKVKLGISRLPLFISWSLTNRCPYRCIYCSSWKRKSSELDVDQICRIIDDLAKCGTGYISFTGGEPFLKESLTIIVQRAIENKIHVNINSSGFGIKGKGEVLSLIDSLTLSLDGPPQIHNLIRCDPQAYDTVIEAVRLGKEAGIKIKLSAVIGRHNANSIDPLLEIAKDLKCLLSFQLATSFKLRGEERNPIALSNTESHQVLENIIKKKKNGAKISNSLSGLRALQNQIFREPRSCWGGKAFFRIDPDGTFHICPRAKSSNIRVNALDGIKQGIDQIGCYHACTQCLSIARTELNCILSGKVDSVINYFQLK